MSGMGSSLGRLVGRSAKTEEELRAMAQAAWKKRGVIVLFPDQVLSWQERALIESAARKLYGDRPQSTTKHQR